MEAKKKKKKVDYEALKSPFMRIPRMDVVAARALIDLGFSDIHQLQGRCPDALFEEYQKHKPDAPITLLAALRLAVYFAETPEPDKNKLHLQAWS
tara:strand:+ start:16737 stop:17021 length:285 start_codon:yes stop_codon:yes gene_type:complete